MTDDHAEAVPDRRRGFGNAVSWAYVQTGGRMVASLLVSLVLARLLGPESFGVLAMATVYVFFIENLARQGLSAAIVQRPELRRSHLDSAFWMTLAAITVLIPLSILLSGWWARVNNTPQLAPIIIGLTPMLALRGLSVVHLALLQREMDFRALAVRTNAAVILGGVAGLVAAFLGLGTWSLVVQQLVLGTVEVVVLWWFSDWRPRLRFDRGRARELLGFSGFSALAGIGSFLQTRVDALVIGLVFGPVAVGLYRLASRLTDMVVEAAGGGVQSVSLSELSQYATDPEGLARRTTQVLRLACLATVPVVGLLVVVSEPLLNLLGPDWAPALTPLRILCLAAWLQLLGGMFGPIMQAAGRPGLLAGAAWGAAGLSAVAFFGAGSLLQGRPIEVQVAGLGVARVLALAVFSFGVVVPILHRAIRLYAGLVLRAIGPISLGVATAVVGTLALAHAWSFQDLPGLVHLVFNGALGTVAIVGTTLAIEPGARELSGTALRRLRHGGWRTLLETS